MKIKSKLIAKLKHVPETSVDKDDKLSKAEEHDQEPGLEQEFAYPDDLVKFEFQKVWKCTAGCE